MGSQQVPTYDYIICGGGQAGCVVAARLAEDVNISVLVIEAGGSKDSVPASDIPAAVAQIFETENDWKILNEPSDTLKGRQLHLTRGKFVSGSSGSNGTLCIRGTPTDFDAWGVDGWSGEEMHRYMSMSENFKDKPWFKANRQAHGSDGPVMTSPHDNAPISDLVMDAFQSKGLLLDDDMFTTGTNPHGCGYAVRSVSQGLRTTAADYFNADNKQRIKIETHSVVDSIIFDKSGSKPRAVGVKMINVIGPAHLGTVAFAKKEVIISAGTYGSPAILSRSGIGPKAELDRLGIETLVDLPAVGKNLEDHLIQLIFYEVNKPDLTTDHKVWHTGAAQNSLMQYQKDRSGFMSQIPFGSFAYARLDERLKDSPLWQSATADNNGHDPMGIHASQPHCEFWNTECYFPNYAWTDLPGDGQYTFALIVELFNARSRGQVTLRSSDPLSNPIVDHNFLSDKLDTLVLSEACRFANEIVTTGKGLKDVIAGPWPRDRKHHTFLTREQWANEIRERVDVCYHPAGTCRMGDRGSSQNVLDPELQVIGVHGLRVVDASVMPKLPSGHPQMAVYAIAEKAATMIKKQANAL